MEAIASIGTSAQMPSKTDPVLACKSNGNHFAVPSLDKNNITRRASDHAAVVPCHVRPCSTSNTPKPKRRSMPFTFIDDYSPKLLSLDLESEPTGAPLLPPPHSNVEPNERFCIGGPILEIEGMGSRKENMASIDALTFPELVTRLEAAVGQASLLFNDRLRTLQYRCANTTLSSSQRSELCDITDGVVGAKYQMEKWAHVLQPMGQINQPPTKPMRCEHPDDAFSSLRLALPRLIVAASETRNGFARSMRLHGAETEISVQQLGISIKDLRALAPHLERLVMRLGRLNSAVKPGPTLKEFVLEYFMPALGRKSSSLVLLYLMGEDG